MDLWEFEGTFYLRRSAALAAVRRARMAVSIIRHVSCSPGGSVKLLGCHEASVPNVPDNRPGGYRESRCALTGPRSSGR